MEIVDVILETVTLLLLGVIVATSFRVGRDPAVKEAPGYRWLVAGFVLLLIGALFDLSDNFTSLNRFVIFGKTPAEAFIEKFFGNAIGYLFLAIGLMKAQGMVDRLRRTQTKLREERLALEAETKARSHVEASLRASEARYRAITETTRDTILILDPDGKVAYANPATTHTFGWGAAELLGRDLHEVLTSSDQRVEFQRAFARFQSTGEGQVVGRTVEAAAVHRDGHEFPIEVSISPMRSDDRWSAVGIIRDISARKEAEAEKHRIHGQLLQAQKMEAIGTLAGGVAHDFNNLLTAIVGLANLALDRVNDTAAGADLNKLLRTTDRAKALVARILTFSRRREVHAERLALRPLVMEVVGLLDATVPPNIEVCAHFECEDCNVSADETQMQQVLMNLCTNAVQAMGEQGHLDLGIDIIELKEEEIDAASSAVPGRYVHLTVRDDGPGMAPEIRDRIFEPFFTTKGVGKGTGLGLSVVHGIIRGHHGMVRVESEVGVGTTFHIDLPAVGEGGRKLGGRSRPKSIPRGHETILLVDDEEVLLDVGRRQLELLGYRVETAKDGAAALALLEDREGAIDLVITDRSMPGMRGDELAHKVHEADPTLPVILTTGRDPHLSQAELTKAGIRHVLPKPHSLAHLAQSVREVLDG